MSARPPPGGGAPAGRRAILPGRAVADLLDGGIVGIVVQVQRTLLRQGAARLVAAGEQGPWPDGCVAAGPSGVAIVRCGPVAVTDAPSWPRHRRFEVTCGLAMCADLLVEAGFRVARAEDGHGPHPRVGH